MNTQEDAVQICDEEFVIVGRKKHETGDTVELDFYLHSPWDGLALRSVRSAQGLWQES